MRDKYNLNTLPANLAGLEDYEMDEQIVIPGMGMGMEEDFNDQQPQMSQSIQSSQPEEVTANNDNLEDDNGVIPGLDLDAPAKKPFIKPIPKNFQEQWNVDSKNDKSSKGTNPTEVLKNVQAVISKVNERLPGVIRIDEQRPNKVTLFGREVEIKRELLPNFLNVCY